MNRTTVAAVTAVTALVAGGLLAGCATAPIAASTPSPTPSATAGTARPSSSPTTASASPSRVVTPSGSASGYASLPATKKISTAKLPSQVADRRTDRVAESAGGQTAAYYKPMDTADVIHAAVSPIGTAADAAARLTPTTQAGPATCGTLQVSGKPTGACVVPLDSGYLLVNGSGGQAVDVVAVFTTALYGTLP